MPDPVTNAVPQTADLWGNSSDPNSAVKQPYGTIGDMQVDHINPATSNVRKVSAPDGSTVIFPKGTTVAQANDQMSSWWDGHTQRAGSLWNGIKNYVSNASQALGGPADLPELQADERDFLLHPDETIKGAIGGLLKGINSAVLAIVPGSEENKAMVARAQQEWHDGNYIAAAETLIPLIGDGLAKASKQAQSRDYSGSLGTATGTILPFLVGGEGALGDTAAQVKGYYLPKSTLTEALPVEDTGLQPKDTGLRPADASLKVPDAGLTPEDAGLRPTETRLSPVPVKAIPTPRAVAVAGGTYATPAPTYHEAADETKPELKTKGGTNPTRSVGAASINDLETKPDVPAFYSKAEQVIGEKVPNNASGEQISALLKNNGVRAEEMKWAGLDDFLKDKPKVSKAELQQFIKENQISLGEEDYGKPQRFKTVPNDAETAHAREPIVDVIDPTTGLVRFTGDPNAAQDYMSELGQGISSAEQTELNNLKADNAVIDAERTANTSKQVRALREARARQRDVVDNFGINSPEAKRASDDVSLAEHNIDTYVEPIEQRAKYQSNSERITDLDHKVLRGASDKPTKYDNWTLPGERENYQEKLLTMPKSTAQQAIEEEYTKAAGERERRAEFGKVPDAVEQRFQKAQEAMRTSKAYVGPHWGEEPNVVAHVRFDERPAVDGKKTLFMEEAQSDWHSAGRHEGYQANPKEIAAADEKLQAAKAAKTAYVQSVVDRVNAERKATGYLSPGELNELSDLESKQRSFNQVENTRAMTEAENQEYYERHQRIAELEKKRAVNNEGMLTIYPNSEQMSWQILHAMTPEESDKFDTLNNAVDSASRAKSVLTQGAVPDAPFKQNWHELVMKRMLREAAEKGYDRLAWTTGKQQADLYDLSKHIGRIEYDPERDELRAYDPQGKSVLEESVEPTVKELAPYIGQDHAKNLVYQIESYEPASQPDPDMFYDNVRESYDIDEREVPDENEEMETVPEREDFDEHVSELAKKYRDKLTGLNGRSATWNDLKPFLTPEELADGQDKLAEAKRAEEEQEENRGTVTQYYITRDGEDADGPYDDKRVARENMGDLIDRDVQHEMDNYEPEQPELPSITNLNEHKGGEFHRLLYDTMIPSFLKKYAKKWGANVGTTEIKGMGEPTVEYQGPNKTLAELEEMKNDGGPKGFSFTYSAMQRLKEVITDMKRGLPFKDAVLGTVNASDSQNLVDGLGGKFLKTPANQKVHSIEITPEMRKSVMKEGQPIAKNTMPHEAEFGPKFKQNLADKMTEALA